MDWFVVAGWMSFLVEDSHIDPTDIDALIDFDEANRDRVTEVVKAALLEHESIGQTGTLVFNNGQPFLHVARTKDRKTDYLERLTAFVADVQAKDIAVYGMVSVRDPDDPLDLFRTIMLGRAKAVG